MCIYADALDVTCPRLTFQLVESQQQGVFHWLEARADQEHHDSQLSLDSPWAQQPHLLIRLSQGNISSLGSAL